MPESGKRSRVVHCERQADCWPDASPLPKGGVLVVGRPRHHGDGPTSASAKPEPFVQSDRVGVGGHDMKKNAFGAILDISNECGHES